MCSNNLRSWSRRCGRLELGRCLVLERRAGRWVMRCADQHTDEPRGWAAPPLLLGSLCTAGPWAVTLSCHPELSPRAVQLGPGSHPTARALPFSALQRVSAPAADAGLDKNDDATCAFLELNHFCSLMLILRHYSTPQPQMGCITDLELEIWNDTSDV